MKIAILGLGEAGSHFANDLVERGIDVSGWDPNLQRELDPRIQMAISNAHAVEGADIVFSVNYTSASQSIAKEVKNYLNQGAIYCEMNTSSPQTKQGVAYALEGSNCRFVDLAIMAPVPPHGINVPLLASGPGASDLKSCFLDCDINIEVILGPTGEAAKRKLLRSIVYKGVAGVICEAMEAGKHYGMEDFMRTQIKSVIGKNDLLIDRFLKGTKTHALRRMHEMEAVAIMLDGQDLSSYMSKAAIQNLRQNVDFDA